MSIETSIVEQMRLQEGRLFQNEQILALYLDVKCVVHDIIIQNKLMETSIDDLETKLIKLAPKGVPNYHARVLYDAVRILSKLLWPSQMLLVAKPKITILLTGMTDRIKANSISSYSSFDPIQQDFMLREAFRRTLVNDCLFVFDDTTTPEDKLDEPMLDIKANGLDTLDADALGPDDSASHIGSRIEPLAPIAERPTGAHSRLGPIDEHVEQNEETVMTLDTDKRSVISKRPDTDVVSVIPKMIPVNVQNDDRKSTMSHVSVNSTASVLRKPMHVKKIIIDTNENTL